MHIRQCTPPSVWWINLHISAPSSRTTQLAAGARRLLRLLRVQHLLRPLGVTTSVIPQDNVVTPVPTLCRSTAVRLSTATPASGLDGATSNATWEAARRSIDYAVWCDRWSSSMVATCQWKYRRRADLTWSLRSSPSMNVGAKQVACSQLQKLLCLSWFMLIAEHDPLDALCSLGY